MQQILIIAGAPREAIGNGARLVAEFVSLTGTLAADKLGVGLCGLVPEKRAVPKHAHPVSEEMMRVLEGAGPSHCGAERAAVTAAARVAAPPGGVGTAHQIENTSAASLRFFTVSTRQEPEGGAYPESGKFAASPHAGNPAPQLRVPGRAAESRDDESRDDEGEEG